LTGEEQLSVIECVVKTTRRRLPVIAGTGTNSTAEAIAKSKAAARAGADGLLVVNPYYNKPTQRGMYEHFAAIARAVDLPIMLYNIPGRCAVELTVPTIAKLRRDCPNIIAMKHATGRVDDAADLMQASDIDVLSGDDPITLPLMSLGAIGVVSVMSNLAPRAVKRLTHAALNGDFAAARDAHRAMYPLMRGLLSLETNPIPIKTALAIRGLCAEEFRLPICPLAPDNRDRLAALLREHPAAIDSM
jgi:4-hydroxy-tetrahydrodipicolinate synthase